MADIVIPSVGIAMEEALLVKWLKEPGEDVAVDEPVAEIETDKATMDLVSPAEGRLGPHLVEAGEVVPVGGTVARVTADDEGDADEPAVAALEEARRPALPTDEAPAPAASERSPHSLSPRARRLAKQRAEQPAIVQTGGRFRELIAARVSESWREIPHFAVSREVGAEALLATVEQLRVVGTAPRPTLTDLLLRALSRALAATGLPGRIDVGLAVATGDGVVIPVVQDVLAKDASALAQARSEAVERARAGRLSPEDLRITPASTLSNLGPLGVDRFTGIIALGQTSLLTVGRAVPRVVADGSRTLSVRTTLDATLNADHRKLDGAEAARLLSFFASAAESMTAAG